MVMNKKYSLCLRRGNNNPLPIDWIYLTNNISDHTYLYSLKEIDEYTSTITEEQLKELLLQGNLIEEEEKDKKIIIMYYDNGYSRILQEGPCFIDDSYYLNKDNLHSFIMDNIYDRVLINKLYNYLSKEKDPKTIDFINLLNYSKRIIKSNDSIGYEAINQLVKEHLNKIPYTSYRKLAMYISKEIMVKEDNYQYSINSRGDKPWKKKENE